MTPYLLRQAYPLGYLPMRGVLTVGGWVCVATTDAGTSRWYDYASQQTVTHYSSVGWDNGAPHAAGDLLPLVDPADTATWACLLADLAEAAFGEPGADSLRIRRDTSDGDRWMLVGASAPGPKTGNRMGLSIVVGIVPTLEPALALVRMRIVFRLREAEEKI